VNGVRAVQPIVQEVVLKSVKAAIAGRKVSITFDGSKVNFAIEGMLARFLNDDHMPTTVCIGCKALKTSVDTEMMRQLIKDHLADAGVAVSQVVAFCSDSGPPNPTAMQEWNKLAGNLYFGQDLVDNTVLWLPCLMHALSNAGTVLRKSLPGVKKFMSGFKEMVNTSSASCIAWTEKTQQSCPGLSEKTFRSWYDRSTPLLDVWGQIPAFLIEAKKRTLAKKSVEKMTEAWKRKTLRAELIFCQQFGKLLRDASFELEGDGFCIAYVSSHLALIQKLSAEVTNQRGNFRMFADAARQAVQDGLPAVQAEDFVKQLMATAQSVLDHFDRAIMSKMKDLMPLFWAAGLFEPHRFAVEWGKLTFITDRPRWLDLLAGLKGVPSNSCVGLDAELGIYHDLVRNRLAEVQATPSLGSPSQLWLWWRGIREKVPPWYAVAAILVLMQPSSAVIERFFSLVKANSSGQQSGESADTFAMRCMCLYNE
jgi:hypothetical protein